VEGHPIRKRLQSLADHLGLAAGTDAEETASVLLPASGVGDVEIAGGVEDRVVGNGQGAPLE
jgi:hypothetical protein